LIISGDVRHRSIRISTLSASDGFAKAAAWRNAEAAIRKVLLMISLKGKFPSVPDHRARKQHFADRNFFKPREGIQP
jgi:hypothetical protein